MKNKTKKNCFTFAGSLLVLIVVFAYGPFFNYFLNRVSLVTSTGYFIPYESSLWDFKPLVPNSGSGEYWLYGEDELRYYYVGNGISYRYVSIKKTEAAKCPGFNPTAFDTWCTSEPPRTRNTE